LLRLTARLQRARRDHVPTVGPMQEMEPSWEQAQSFRQLFKASERSM
jgi:hypothetical protein